jgi:hypothetical protein
MTADAFPSLAGTNSNAGPLYNSDTRSFQKQQQQQQRGHALPPKLGVRRSISAPSFAEAAKQQNLQQQQQQQQHHSQQRKQQQHHHHHQQERQQQQSQQQQQQQQHVQQQHHTQQDMQQLVQQLSHLHPWCDSELLQEVLASVDNNTAAAAAALADLAPAGARCQHNSSSFHGKEGSSVGDDTASSSCSSGVASDTGAVEELYHAPSSSQLLQPSLQQHEVGPGDIYHSVRRDALRLTRQWQKVLRR